MNFPSHSGPYRIESILTIEHLQGKCILQQLTTIIQLCIICVVVDIIGVVIVRFTSIHLGIIETSN